MSLVCRLLLSAIILAFVSCRPPELRDVAAIQNALDSFVYVGDAVDVPDGKVADHKAGTVTFPARLAKGRQYIFHRKHATPESWIAVQNSLQRNGATIVSAPKGNVGLSYTYIGGPWYVIESRLGSLQCSFQNRPAIELESKEFRSEFEPEDFILRREQ